MDMTIILANEDKQAMSAKITVTNTTNSDTIVKNDI